MAATIKDVAREAGVSISTVSRILNNKGSFPQETRMKIQNVMNELNYHPNSIARNFVNGSTSNIGLVINTEDSGTYSNEFFNRSVFGIETVAHTNDYNLLIAGDRRYANGVTTAEKLAYEKKVDGLVLPSALVRRSTMKRLQEAGLPYVILGEPEYGKASCNWADINNGMGAELAVAHLVEKGYRRITFFSSGSDKVFNKNRIAGYRQGIKKNGLQQLESLICEGKPEVEEGHRLLLSLFEEDNPPDALISSDSLMAFGALKAVREKHLHIPSDFGIVSFDNYPLTNLSEPELTTVDIDTYELGIQVAQILMQAIQKGGNVYHQSLITTRIVSRESTNRNEKLK